MLQHATLLRVDPPDSAEPGPAIVLRAALTTPTRTDLSWLDVNGLSATAVVYVAISDDVPAIAANAVLAVRQDDLIATEWRAVHAADFVGVVSRYRKVFVVPVVVE